METINETKPLEITGKGLTHLTETRKWTLFISIVGFVFIGVCIAVVPLLITRSFSDSYSGPGYLTTLPIILVVILYFFPIYFLLKFSLNSKKAIVNSNGTDLESALKYLKYHYRFMGICVIFVVILYLTLILYGVFHSVLK